MAEALLPPSGPLHTSRLVWPSGQPIHRIHQDLYAADTFNPGVAGNARFSPIATAAGAAIPTLYGGTSFECAAMETIFHDVPFVAGFKSYDKRKLLGQVHSVLLPSADLQLVDLSHVALRKLGVRRDQLIDTEKDGYPLTRQWAQALYTQCAEAQGLCWVSRQDDRSRAVVLFGNRIAAGVLLPQGASRNLLADVAVYGQVLDLADAMGVCVVPGKA